MSDLPSVLPNILTRLDQLADGIGELKAELVAVGTVGQQTLIQATRTNGRMTQAEERLTVMEARHAAEDNVAKGRKDQRADDLKIIDGIRAFASEFWPLIVGAALGGVGVSAFLWNSL